MDGSINEVRKRGTISKMGEYISVHIHTAGIQCTCCPDNSITLTRTISYVVDGALVALLVNRNLVAPKRLCQYT